MFFLLFFILKFFFMVEERSLNRTTILNVLFTLLRIALGLILLWKSINFVEGAATTKMYIEQTGIGVFSRNAEMLDFIITYLGLLCGFFITVGLFTRAAAIVQIPILLVAVFFVNVKNIGSDVFELVLSVITLFLLILFAFKGSGVLSADEYFRIGAAMDNRSKKAFT